MLSTITEQVTFASTLNKSSHPQFVTRARPLVLPPQGRVTLLDELQQLFRLLKVAFQEDFLLLNSSWGRIHPDLLTAAIMGLLPKRRRPVAVLSGCMWAKSSGIRGLVEKLVVKLADRTIHRYAVQSSEELHLFARTWGIDESKTRLCLYYFRAADRVDLNEPPPPPGDHIFAGGNSHRDYEPLLEAARYFPDRRFILATHRLDNHPDLPPNVTAGPLEFNKFADLTRSAAAVVVPLQRGLNRAIGQQTYLDAMWFGKPTIVTDSLGVRDHIRDGETGLIVDGSPESYVNALRWVLDPAHREQVARLGATAHQVVSEQFTVEKHTTALLAIMDEAIQAAKTDKAAK